MIADENKNAADSNYSRRCAVDARMAMPDVGQECF